MKTVQTSLFTILFATFLSETFSLVCLSSLCPNGGVCNDYCPGSSDVCHLTTYSVDMKEFESIEMSCSHSSTINCSNECIPEPIHTGNFYYCCCTTDYCNHMPGETDHLIPVLEIPTNLPPEPRPSKSNSTVCEDYRCSPDKQTCSHRYEICEVKDNVEPYCSASYIVNADNKLELKLKGCENEPLLHNCYNSTECHIDNQFNDAENNFYVCCCDESYCNQNISFTHPTEHSQYGLLECETLNCDQMCLIENNKPRCTCMDGYYRNESSSSCIDIDECELLMSSCDIEFEVCVNTIGGYTCECKSGFHFHESLNTCIRDDGIVCDSYRCFKNGTCVESLEHCGSTAADETLSDPKYHFCIAVFKALNDSFIHVHSSCLHGAHVCPSDQCLIQNRSLVETNLYTCCCYGDLCNLRSSVKFLANLSSVSDVSSSTSSSLISSVPSLSTTLPPLVAATSNPVSGEDFLATPIAIAFVAVLIFVVLLIVIVITIMCVLKCYIKQKNLLTSMEVIVPPPPPDSQTALPILDTVIGQGRFAKVYCAKMNDDQVAIKIFNNTLQAKESWNREKEIYSELQHPNILRFLDADRHMHEGVDTFWLIFEYQPNGSLYDYLQHHTVSLKEFSTLTYSAACGLAHLHSDISIKDGGVVKKPPIAHRDLKSKNILVKQDMTSCISDFGLAIKLNSGEHQNDAQGQVGTSRYMAPEVLEGAISFHQESFLNIDVYAFGLVMWEIASRCDIPNNSLEEYRPPFEDIVSPNPTIGEMRRIVAEQRKRPNIPLGFRNKPGYESVVDTIVECWDADADARPSTHLLESRLYDFHELVNSKHSQLKESGYLSHHAVPSSINLTSTSSPIPLTPCSSSQCVTMSPSDTKTMQFNDCPPPDPSPGMASDIDQMYFRSSFHSSTFDSGHSEDIQETNGNNPHSLPNNLRNSNTDTDMTSFPPHRSEVVEVECYPTRNSGVGATPSYGQLESSI